MAALADVAEAMLAVFDSKTMLVWTTTGAGTAIATFTYNGFQVATTFAKVSENEWQVGFALAPDPRSGTTEGFYSSVRILSGVFQAVHEFLEVRQPARLVFASKQEALGSLYETYLERQDTALKQLGYRMVTKHIEPLVEFALEKSTPSAWVS